MNIALWIVQGLLGLAFLMFGMMKAFQYEKAQASLPWAKNSSKGFVNFIGFAELLGGLGLILPWALGIADILTPIAAIALGFIMLFAAVFHTKRKENQAIGMNIVFLALLIFIAIGRL